MTFQKNHKLGFTSSNPLDDEPICFKGRIGQKQALKNIPDHYSQVKLKALLSMSKITHLLPVYPIKI